MWYINFWYVFYMYVYHVRQTNFSISVFIDTEKKFSSKREECPYPLYDTHIYEFTQEPFIAHNIYMHCIKEPFKLPFSLLFFSFDTYKHRQQIVWRYMYVKPLLFIPFTNMWHVNIWSSSIYKTEASKRNQNGSINMGG